MSKVFKLVLLCTAVLIGACQQPGGSADKVAVIDLNEIATVTGQDAVIREKVDASRVQLTEQLQTLLGTLEAELVAEREKLGANPGEADLQRVQALTMQAQQQMGEAQNQAQIQVGALEAQLAEEFSGSIRPLAQLEAQSSGANLVLAKDAYIFWSADAINITDAVVAAWQKQSGAASQDDAVANADAASEGVVTDAPAEEGNADVEASTESAE
jgi:Skp family chaperone for outer membrane proteins